MFPDYYVGILQSAELTGQLDTALESLSDYLDREIETRSKVVSALSYPMVVMVMAMITVLILAGYVLPQFKPLFRNSAPLCRCRRVCCLRSRGSSLICGSSRLPSS